MKLPLVLCRLSTQADMLGRRACPPLSDRVRLPWQAVKVNSLGKWKTACQMVGLSALLAFREGHLLLGSHPASAQSTQHSPVRAHPCWVLHDVPSALRDPCLPCEHSELCRGRRILQPCIT